MEGLMPHADKQWRENAREFVLRNPRSKTAPQDRGARFSVIKAILCGMVRYDPDTNMVKRGPMFNFYGSRGRR
jgi:hypothetical protein